MMPRLIYSISFGLLVIFGNWISHASALPPGFEDEGLFRITAPVDIEFLDTSTILAATDYGLLYSFNLSDPDAKPKVVLDLRDRVCTNGERGLSSVAVHPKFTQNRWIYLFYTFDRGDKRCLIDIERGPVNRCSRFVMNKEYIVDPDSEVVLFTNYGQKDQLHNAGDMAFGVDGHLYVTTGDAGARQRGYEWAQDRSNLHGNIIRITDSGAIPDDNPFTGKGTSRCHEIGKTFDGLICQEIYAYGLRNPFRFTMDPHSSDKVRFLISYVGGKTWEEINVGGEDHKGINYGWPIIEGPCRFNSVTRCSIGDDNSEFRDPLYWYQHDNRGSGCVVGLAVPPKGLNWPSPYNNPSSIFFADFAWGEIFHIAEDQGRYCETCSPPHPGFVNETFHEVQRSPVALKFGFVLSPDSAQSSAPQQALYYAARMDGINIRRIVYKGGENFSPMVTFTVDKLNALVGELFRFDGSTTMDANHALEELIFSWDFGDGSIEETGKVVFHQYAEVGVYRVKLTVIDPDGAMGKTLEEVSVGAPPSVTILSPTEGTAFAVGDVLVLVGEGRDHLGNILSDEQLTWEVRKHHTNHFHPFLTEGTVGNNFSITKAPEPEDFFAATNSYLEILLTGTDNDGISTTISQKVMPRTLYLDFDSIPSGLTLVLDEEELTMPQRVLSWENHSLQVYCPDQGDYLFAGWGNGMTKNATEIVVPPASDVIPSFVALFQQVDVPSAEPSGSPTFVPTISPTTRPLTSPSNVPTVDPTTTLSPPGEDSDAEKDEHVSSPLVAFVRSVVSFFLFIFGQ